MRPIERPPSGALLTTADTKNFPRYLQILEAVRAGQTFAQIARMVFGKLQPTPTDLKTVQRYYKRAIWLTEIGWRQIPADISETITHGVFTTRMIARLGLLPWQAAFADLKTQAPFADFVRDLTGHAAAHPGWRTADADRITTLDPETWDASATARIWADGLEILATHSDHPLWPLLGFMALARLCARQDLSNAPDGFAFFATAMARSLKDVDAAKLASVTGTLQGGLRAYVLGLTAAACRDLVLDLFLDHPSDTVALLRGPLDARDQPKAGLLDVLGS
jgi:hypothetical protein